MNYTELTTAIKNYCDNTEQTFVDTIPTFVKQAENRIYRKVNLPANYKSYSASLVVTNNNLTLPSDFLAPAQLLVTSGNDELPLLFRDKSFIRQAYPDTTVTGLPEFYCIFDSTTIKLAPTPDSAYSVKLYYYHMPSSIVDATNTWLGDNSDEVLLYGSLIEAYTFMKGDADMLALYQQRYEDALAALKVQAEGRMTVDEFDEGMIRVPRV